MQNDFNYAFIYSRGHFLINRISDLMNFLFQRMRDSALSKSGAQTFEFISKHVLCRSDIFHGRLWRFRTGHLALTTLHGHHDLRGTHSVTNTGVYTF